MLIILIQLYVWIKSLFRKKDGWCAVHLKNRSRTKGRITTILTRFATIKLTSLDLATLCFLTKNQQCMENPWIAPRNSRRSTFFWISIQKCRNWIAQACQMVSMAWWTRLVKNKAAKELIGSFLIVWFRLILTSWVRQSRQFSRLINWKTWDDSWYYLWLLSLCWTIKEIVDD